MLKIVHTRKKKNTDYFLKWYFFRYRLDGVLILSSPSTCKSSGYESENRIENLLERDLCVKTDGDLNFWLHDLCYNWKGIIF